MMRFDNSMTTRSMLTLPGGVLMLVVKVFPYRTNGLQAGLFADQNSRCGFAGIDD
jgi:hypothetical protein